MTSSNKKIADQGESCVWNAELKTVERSAKKNMQGQKKSCKVNFKQKTPNFEYSSAIWGGSSPKQ